MSIRAHVSTRRARARWPGGDAQQRALLLIPGELWSKPFMLSSVSHRRETLYSAVRKGLRRTVTTDLAPRVRSHRTRDASLRQRDSVTEDFRASVRRYYHRAIACALSFGR